MKLACVSDRHHGGSWHPSIALHHTGLWLHTIVCLPLWDIYLQHSDWAAISGSKCQFDVRAGEGKTLGHLAWGFSGGACLVYESPSLCRVGCP